MNALPDSYIEAHRYDGGAVEHGRRDELIDLLLQPRDIGILRDVWRYKFLTATQLFELWWPGRTRRAGQRRLTLLFQAELLERFRPFSRRGSFPWTYHLGRKGHRTLQQAQAISRPDRYEPKAIYDYGYVLHEIHLNAWVLAYRRLLGDALLTWEGETDIKAPPGTGRAQLRLDDDWSVEGLRDSQQRPLRPDAVIEVARENGTGSRTFLIEHDRTRRVDKNYEKFRRYDAFLNWWWRHTHFADQETPPYVLFICQDDLHREAFLAAADRELTGHAWHPSASTDQHAFVGRRRILFASEPDVHAGTLEARRVAHLPRGHTQRRHELDATGRVRLPPRPTMPRPR